jgi:hypothetical protein
LFCKTVLRCSRHRQVRFLATTGVSEILLRINRM